MEDLFVTYGPYIVYTIVFLWSIIEGETFILLGGALAYKYDEISLAILMLLAFLGSCTADQTLFFVGRRYGPSMIERYEFMKKASKKVFYHLHRHSTLFIISFRFIYGVRTAAPLTIGASGVDPLRFSLLNFFAAALWSVLSCSAGYLIGYFFADAIEDFIINFVKYNHNIVLVLLALLLFSGGMFYLWKRRQNR
ncbi:MAG: DedA family protein [Alphaproteobacteria bacterium]